MSYSLNNPQYIKNGFKPFSKQRQGGPLFSSEVIKLVRMINLQEFVKKNEVKDV
jgi:hypothetical protein